MGPRPRFSQSGPMVCPYFACSQASSSEFGCHEWSINGPAPASVVPQIKGSSPSPGTNAPQSAPRKVVPPLTLLPLTLLYSSQTVDSNLDGNAKAPSIPSQRVITAHLMHFQPSHQYVLGNISLTRSEQTLSLQSSLRFKACSGARRRRGFSPEPPCATRSGPNSPQTFAIFFSELRQPPVM